MKLLPRNAFPFLLPALSPALASATRAADLSHHGESGT